MSDHSCRVDYFSYTIKAKQNSNNLNIQANSSLWHTSIAQLCPAYLLKYREEWDFKVPKRRNGYNFGFNVDSAIYCWFNGKDIHVEITGDGCTMLYETGELIGIIHENTYRATRIDIAHDIVTDVSPGEFVKEGKQTLARGTDISKTGETRYVGSPKSDRYCKVYRYNKPHPRADRLRIEYTYMKDDAIIVCQLLKTTNEAIVAFSSGKRYEWAHDCYKTLQSPDLIEIKAHRKDRNTAKTVIWYKTQVLPAIKKMLRSGDYTMDDILKDLRGLNDVQ